MTIFHETHRAEDLQTSINRPSLHTLSTEMQPHPDPDDGMVLASQAYTYLHGAELQEKLGICIGL